MILSKNMKKDKKDCCFCPEIMKLNEMKNIKIQIIEYKLREILEFINEDIDKMDRYEF